MAADLEPDDRDDEREHPTIELNEAYRAHLERVRHDLRAVLEHHEPTAGARLVMNGMLEETNEALRLILDAYPWSKLHFEKAVEQILESVRASGLRPQ